MDKYNNRETIKRSSFISTFFGTSKEGKKNLSYRSKRWILVIAIHLLFFLSFSIDIQVLEGTLNGSRFLGFHLIDIFTTIEVYLAIALAGKSPTSSANTFKSSLLKGIRRPFIIAFSFLPSLKSNSF